MCGIAGIFREKDPVSLRTMLELMNHRGPDHTGTHVDDDISLGMVRLSIIDVTESANQPMVSRNNDVVLVYNGEMYNFLEERKKLTQLGYKFLSDSDTEVVLALYLHYGIEFLKSIRGMFSLAIYDMRESDNPRLILARDPLGIKPLLYSQNNGRILFASELKALLGSGYIDKEIEYESLRQLFTFGSVKQPGTMISGVNMLPPGSYLLTTKRSEETEIKRYSPNYFECDPAIKILSYEEQKELVYDSLVDSVQKHLVSDVPIGAFLSGGVDSSLIVSLMTQVLGKKVKTFSVGFEYKDQLTDESDDAKKIAEHLQCDHQNVIVTGQDFRDDFFKIILSLDQPSVDGVNSYFVSKAAADVVRVSLSGTGGDELFTGYPWFVNMMNYDRRKKRPLLNGLNRFLFKNETFNAVANGEGKVANYFERYRRGLSFLSQFSRLNIISHTLEVKKLFNDKTNDKIQYPLDIAFDYLDIYDESIDSTINQVSNLCINGYLRNQLLRDIDAMSMAHSLEVRVPFVDTKVLQLAMSLSDQTKIKNGVKQHDPTRQTYRELGSKRVLIDIGKRFLPEDYDNQPKRGFSLPFQEWMRDYCSDIIEDVFSGESIDKRGIFDKSSLNKMLAEYKSGQFQWTGIWLVVVFEYWCREFLDT